MLNSKKRPRVFFVAVLGRTGRLFGGRVLCWIGSVPNVEIVPERSVGEVKSTRGLVNGGEGDVFLTP